MCVRTRARGKIDRFSQSQTRAIRTSQLLVLRTSRSGSRISVGQYKRIRKRCADLGEEHDVNASPSCLCELWHSVFIDFSSVLS